MKILAAAIVALAFAAPAAAAPKLSAADRAAITQSIDIFVNHAVRRVNAGASWDVVAPELRAGETRKSWARGGDLPVYPFPAQGKTHPWNILYVTREEVGLELELIPPAGTEQGPIIFHIYLRPVGKRWLVDSFMPVATLAPLGAKHKTKVRSVRDFSPQAAGGVSLGATGPHRLSAAWLALPFVVILGAFAGLAGWGVVRYVRARAAPRGARPPVPRLPRPLPGPAGGGRPPLRAPPPGGGPRGRRAAAAPAQPLVGSGPWRSSSAG